MSVELPVDLHRRATAMVLASMDGNQDAIDFLVSDQDELAFMVVGLTHLAFALAATCAQLEGKGRTPQDLLEEVAL